MTKAISTSSTHAHGQVLETCSSNADDVSTGVVTRAITSDRYHNPNQEFDLEWYKLAQEKRLQVSAAQDQMQRLCKLQVLGVIARQKECDPPVPIC